MAMTAAYFSSNTNIFSPSPQRHLPVSHLRSSSAIQIPLSYNKQKFNYSCNTSMSGAPIPTGVYAAATGTADLHVHDSASTSITSSWVEFAEKVSGEWDGFGADFTAKGEAVELPEMVVPEAYREWEVRVFDWQTQCPTLAESGDNSPSLMYRSVKLLPTVGCEADAATVYTTEQRNISAPRDSAFAYSSTGCYVAEWPTDSAVKSMELEHCLINPTNKESRVRIIQALALRESELKLVGIKVFVEQWYGPFRNGDQLGGCAIRDSAFATTDCLKASRVTGAWQGRSTVAKFDASHNVMMIQELGDEGASKSIREERDLILLPKQLWSSVTRADDNETCCEVGWLLGEGRAIISKCIFSSTAELKEIAIANETATGI